MFRNWPRLVEAWEARKEKVELANVSRFWGAKSSIGRTIRDDGTFEYKRHETDEERTRYGQWFTDKVDLSFNPRPKRAELFADGTMSLRSFARDVESHPYDRSLSPESLALKEAAAIQLEQPDAEEYVDYADLD
jgi:hypothetical protein